MRDWNILDLGSRLGDFADTAAVMKHLDLVISVDTAVVHLAGALSVPVWVALCTASDWRWLQGRDDTPWYPSVRLFRQRRWGDWAGVFERMASELSERKPSLSAPIEMAMTPGQLFDQITTLEVERSLVRDDDRRTAINIELGRLLVARARSMRASVDVDRLTELLREVNGKRRQIEDDIDFSDGERDGDEPLRELAMLLYRVNQRRCAIKRQLDELVHGAGQPVNAGSWHSTAILAS